MTDIDKLTLLKTMVNPPIDDENWSDGILLSYLRLAGRKIINRAYPYDDSIDIVPKKYETLQCEIAAFMLNKRGAEGQTSHSENGVSRSYENGDVPESMLSEIVPHCGVF